MAELQLKSQRFRDERQADWRRLERLLELIEGGSPRNLTSPTPTASGGCPRSSSPRRRRK